MKNAKKVQYESSIDLNNLKAKSKLKRVKRKHSLRRTRKKMNQIRESKYKITFN